MSTPRIRTARLDDHARIVDVVDDWWGRPVADMLPRLFLDHFCDTSLVADDDTGDATLLGFLVGFRSPARPDEAYVHFAGVHPDWRHVGLGRQLYERFFEVVPATVVRAITSPQNAASIAFHRRLGFSVEGPMKDWDRAGVDRVVFTYRRFRRAE